MTAYQLIPGYQFMTISVFILAGITSIALAVIIIFGVIIGIRNYKDKKK